MAIRKQKIITIFIQESEKNENEKIEFYYVNHHQCLGFLI